MYLRTRILRKIQDQATQHFLPGDDDATHESLLHRAPEHSRVVTALLVDFSDLIEDGVSPEDLVADLATQQDLGLVLPDGGDVRGDPYVVIAPQNGALNGIFFSRFRTFNLIFGVKIRTLNP